MNSRKWIRKPPKLTRLRMTRMKPKTAKPLLTTMVPLKKKRLQKRPTPENNSGALQAQLDRLRFRIKDCSKCFPRGGNCPVPGTGPAKTGGLFLIGQAP